jgi:endonuclease G
MSNQTLKKRQSGSNSLLWIAIIIVILIVVLYTCHKQKSQQPTATHHNNITKGLNDLQVPEIKPNDEIVQHAAYTLSFNPQHKEANWVAYLLTNYSSQSAHYNRTNRFLIDPLVKEGSADDADYEGSGYDRGHLAPAEDMSYSSSTMTESFYYSNMTPQVPAFNRGVWKRLEELVRYWSTVYDSLYIVTGPVLTNGLPSIGHDKVSVPQLFYKVVLEYNHNGAQGIGFILPNEASAKTLKSFAVSIDSVEHLTGINFFSALPDQEEEAIESKADISDWRWTRKTLTPKGE